jgi:uncharacterized damage-inducible protein DinB
MSQPQESVAFFYQGWETFQDILIKALEPLSNAQLALRAAPNLRTVEENATHIIGARGRWCHLLMGLGDEAFAALGEWDRPHMPDRNAAELVAGLRQSMQVIQAALQQWTPADLAFAYPNDDREPGEPESFTRQWVIWHLIEHDIYHGGEISQILGAHSITGVDL